jgi:hypothetical protein
MHLSEAGWIGVISIVAILVGPIAAVWVTRRMDQHRVERDRRMDVFRSLMRTRRLRLSPDHVSALNLVEIEFYNEADVKAAWKDYFTNLVKFPPDSASERERESHMEEQNRLLAKLLHAMAKSLKFYNLEQIDIMQGGYTPQGWQDVETQQTTLRLLLIDLFQGKRAMPVTPVVSPSPTSPYPPAPPDIIEEQASSGTGGAHK